MDLTNITQLLLQQIGLDHGTIGESSIELGVRTRMQALRLTDVAAYVACVTVDRAELQALIEEVIVPETWFFRGFDQLRYMAEVGSQWRPSFPGHALRVLSIPCSSGEEPYSIYLFLRHHGLVPSQIRIVAADISQRSIDRATRGVYGDLSFRETGPLCDVLRHRFFERDSNQTVIPEVRSAVQFRQDNLISPTFLADAGVFDMIFCRNLLIYFDQPSRQLALQSLQRLLAPNGYVFGGHAEQLAILDPQLKSVGPVGAFAYQRIDVASVTNAEKPSSPLIRNPTHNIPPAQPAFKSAFAPDLSGTALAAGREWQINSNTPVASAIPLKASTIQDLLASAEHAANSGRLSDALSLCVQHFEQHGPTASAMCLMGVIQNAAGELADAEKSFQKAVYLDPAHKDSLWHLKLLAEKRGDQRAVETFNRRLTRATSSKK
ncbi:MAG: hypothetical protein IAG10_17870 [Planctomycetaceae bacterium]|nr:hypothetical protein [Planctomycetaceae bacterium]